MEGDTQKSAAGPSAALFDFEAVDEAGALLLGAGDGEPYEQGWGTLESGGALLSSGTWSISTEPGEEGLRWNCVKTEFGGGSGSKAWAGASTTGAPAIKRAATAPTGTFLGPVKADPDEAWEGALTSSFRSPLGSAAARLGGQVLSRPVVHGSNLSSPHVQMFSSSTPTTAGAAPIKAAAKAVARRSGASATSRSLSLGRINAAKAVATTRRPSYKVEARGNNVEEEEDDDDEDEEDDDGGVRDGDSEELDAGSELNDKRRRNREHAKRSRMRKRVRLGGLESMVLSLRRENVRLRQLVKQGIPERAGEIIRTCARNNTNADMVAKQDVVQGMRPGMSIGSSSSGWSTRSGAGGSRSRSRSETDTRHRGGSGSRGGKKDRRVPSALKLMSPCYQAVKALSESQANFILTNPNLPDCPIIFASQGFLDLTGYEASKVIGKNCRFLQGPGTDPSTVSIVRNNLVSGRDTSVCILNYKADGTPFWNQLSIGVLLDAHGQVANHVGVLCEVNQMPPAVFHRLLHRVPLPESLLNDESSDSGDDALDDSPSSTARAGSSRSSRPGAPGSGDAAPRVVDRLRRTRASAASASAPS